MSHMLRAYARAKLNLSLTITGKRDDGYHLLHSIVAFCDVADIVTVKECAQLELAMDGPFAYGLSSGDNLVLRAARALQQHTRTSRGACITLSKHLPVASGIGGGSSDAAITLRLLNQYWKTGLSDGELTALASPLGADMAMCLHGHVCIAENIGDVITPLPQRIVHGMHAVLVNPLVSVATPTIFAKLTAREYGSPSDVSDEAMLPYKTLADMRNDLQVAACRTAPVIDDVLSALRKAARDSIAIRMSGSGATCFALVNDRAKASHIAQKVATAHPEWWVAHGALR